MTHERARERGRLRPLADPARRPLPSDYWKLWTASAVSNLGDGVTVVAMPLLAATITRSPAAIAMVSLAERLPWALFALLGGVAADRADRRRLMAGVDSVRMLAIGGLGAVVLAGWESLPLIAGVAFALGTAECFFDNAAQALMPGLVGRDQLERANGRMYAAEIVTNEFVGPPFGSALFAAAAAAPFLLDAASFGFAALLVLLIRGAPRPARVEQRPSLRADVAEGLRWLWHHRLIRTLAIMLGLWNLWSTATYSIFVLYALEPLGLSERGYGVLLGVMAAGSLVGSLAAERVVRRVGAARSLLGAVVVGGAATAVPGLVVHPAVAAATLAVTGFVSVVWNVITVSLRQSVIPDRLLGRVNSGYRLFGWGTMPVGAALGGGLAEAFGLRVPFVVAGAGIAAMAAFAWRVVNQRTIDDARAAAAA